MGTGVEGSRSIGKGHEAEPTGTVKADRRTNLRAARRIEELESDIRPFRVGIGCQPCAKCVGAAAGVDIGLADGWGEIHLLSQRTGVIKIGDAMPPGIVIARILRRGDGRPGIVSGTVIVGLKIADPADARSGFEAAVDDEVDGVSASDEGQTAGENG